MEKTTKNRFELAKLREEKLKKIQDDIARKALEAQCFVCE
jgi:hypothetical protein